MNNHTATTDNHTAPSPRFDYDRQTWLVRTRPGQWTVDKCGHLRHFRGCFACEHAGETFKDSDVNPR